MRAHVPLALVLALATLAGCAEDAARPAAASTATSPATASADRGAVAGVVVDESYQPVPGADVALGTDPSVSVVTDAAGGFLLADLPPGRHWLLAQRIGYHAARIQVEVDAGAVLDGVEFILSAVERPAQPYREVTIGEAFIACSANAPGAAVTFTQACGADPNNDPTYDFDVVLEHGLVSLLVEMAWTPTNDAMAQELRLGLWKGVTCSQARCDADVVYAYANGGSPLRLPFGNASEPFDRELNVKGPTTLTAVALVGDSPVVPRADDPGVHVVWQQPVTFYVTRFHHGAMPEGHSEVPSG